MKQTAAERDLYSPGRAGEGGTKGEVGSATWTRRQEISPRDDDGNDDLASRFPPWMHAHDLSLALARSLARTYNNHRCERRCSAR